MKRLALLFPLLAISSSALAHPGHGADGFVHGFAHPFAGLDHLLAMLAVGLWAARFHGVPRWILPLAFVSFMALGGGLSLPMVEPMIAVSVLVLGLGAAIGSRLPVATGAAVTALFALYHGQAHFAEIPAGASAAGFALGMLSATALLHGAGLALALQLARARRWRLTS
jgi:urease accessory protein